VPNPEKEPLRRKPDISLATSKLGFQPKIALDQGLIKTCEYFKSLV
jgi:UDP-glucuronate decarboxylase